ncbi:MAG: molybdate transport system substrate-binding protein [Paraglaciecola sp.]|jgi:molybdate transport system substrate-binding protein
MVSIRHLSCVFFYSLLLGIFSIHSTAKTHAPNEMVRVAVASNFKPVLEQLIIEFKRLNPASQIQISSASSGVLYAQILRGAPFDLFLSADSLRPTLLEEQGLIEANSRLTYALGQLVLWSSDKSLLNIDELRHYSGKIAIANPELAPFGRASQQTLTALGMWPDKKNNVVMANNVLQVAHMIHSGAVSLGMVSASQVNNVPKQQLWFVPGELFGPIVQQIVILNEAKSDSQHLHRVKSFYRYLLSTKGQQIIAANGYKVAANSVSINELTSD